MLVPILMGTNMAAANQRKHLSLSFATKGEIHLSRNSKTIKITLFSNARTVQMAKFPEISHFLHLLYEYSFPATLIHHQEDR